MGVGLISQAVSIGFLLQAFAGQLVLALIGPAVVSLTAESYHAIAVPLCFEQAGCLLIIHPTGSIVVPSTKHGAPQACHDVHEIGPVHITGLTREPRCRWLWSERPPSGCWLSHPHACCGLTYHQWPPTIEGPHKPKSTKPGWWIGPIDGG